MRLEKIKLAGFKSFIDPTTIPIPGSLVAIVGPNGCGKSNIIDAVRWVMGESSAKHLRGGTMADVIFNGSSTRKPVGLASVELLFDNREGRCGGEFAKYSSISIKRQVSRDGLSVYSLNGSRCRRKDITDIFLGTGLGPRSYAIIEQGTISRLIEAKPEDLRVFIEEAAGISKYKERRHETELRMGHTRENLARLEDLRDEVGKQFKHLKAQATKAEKYLALKKEERRFKQELLAMRWRSYDQSLRDHDSRIATLQSAHDRLLEEQNRLDEQIAEAREQHKQLQRELNETQGTYYALVADISRIEQTIKHARMSQQELADELGRLRTDTEQTRANLEHDTQQLEDIQQEQEKIKAELEEAQALEAESLEMQQEMLRKREAWQKEWGSYKSRSAQRKEQVEVQRARIQQMEEQGRQLEQRLERLESERSDLADQQLDLDNPMLGQAIAALEAEHAENQQQLDTLNRSVVKHRQQARDYHDELNRVRSELQQNQGKITSLELLQHHAMGKDRTALTKWLEEFSLHSAPRLAQHLEVQPGWESAVEMVLGLYLEAVCLDDAQPLLTQLDAVSGESLAIFETRSPAPAMPERPFVMLVDQVHSPWNLHALLGGIYCAEDLPAAKALCSRLEEHESVVTPDGIWLGPGWLLMKQTIDNKSGVLQREKELRSLNQHRKRLSVTASQLEQQLAEAEENLKAAEEQRESLQQQDRVLAAECSRKQAELSENRARHEQIQKRLSQIEHEIADIKAIQVQNEQAIRDATRLKDEAGDALLQLEEQEPILTETSRQHSVELDEANAAVEGAAEQVHALRSRLEALSASESLTRTHVQRLNDQCRHASARKGKIESKLQETASPLDQEKKQLAGLLAQRSEMDQALTEARQRLEESETSMTASTEERTRIERSVEEKRARLEQARMDKQGDHVRMQTVTEQLQEQSVDVEAVLEALPADADEAHWHQSVEDLGVKIGRLGSINLAAIEECDAQSERMQYLDRQYADLNESLVTLEQAIDKINNETKTRFKDTFERVNNGLKGKFPKLFGGGEAFLQLDDHNLLEAGVNVIARPPGKRTSSIHLLSGGEKALTAVALVFSIFELNPAPFCLLDEVDAPLDDANVGRFCQLLKEMSEAVQFLFITHNKMTMEIAKHLTGVTMKEPGVSRMVAVDIDEAVELAAV
jgi:chromosome segregation protein